MDHMISADFCVSLEEVVTDSVIFCVWFAPNFPALVVIHNKFIITKFTRPNTKLS